MTARAISTEHTTPKRARRATTGRPAKTATPYSLDQGELDVLFLMLQGEYAREIAGDLGIPVAEVQTRQLSIRAKMGAKSCTEAAVRAIREHVFPSMRPPLRVVD